MPSWSCAIRLARKVKTAHEANALRWRRGIENYYEIYYLTLNQLSSKTGFWIRYCLHAPIGSGPYLEVWFNCFDGVQPRNSFGVMQRYPLESLSNSQTSFSLHIAHHRLTNGMCQGRLEGKGHSAQWDLRFVPQERPFLHLPESLYAKGKVVAAMLSPHVSTRFDGEISVDGRTIVCEADPGEQSHTWGRQHAPHWLWAHCNFFEDDAEAVMELVCIPKAKDKDSPGPAHVFWIVWKGQRYRLASMLDGSKSENSAFPGTWKLEAESDTTRLRIQIRCRTDDCIEATYADPNGESCYCVHTDLADSDVEVWTRHGDRRSWQLRKNLRSDGTTHAEWGDYFPHEQIKRKVLAIS